MTIKDLISRITSEGYSGKNLFLRLTGRADNNLLMKGEKINGKFYFSSQVYNNRKEALKEIKRLIQIYYVTDKPGLRTRYSSRCYGYNSQIINS